MVQRERVVWKGTEVVWKGIDVVTRVIVVGSGRRRGGSMSGEGRTKRSVKGG